MSEKGISRRTFIQRALLGAGALTGLGWGGWKLWKRLRPSPVPPIAGEIVGANSEMGHLLRQALQAPIEDERETGVLIVGAGVAGLSAAWQLKKEGITDFRILELDEHPGGNSAYDVQKKAPWGAHYLPVPDPANEELVALCRELGLYEDYLVDGWPVVKEEHLCHDPQERLLIHGHWQDGLVPRFGVPKEELEQQARFFGLMEEWKYRKGKDGLFAFDIPLDRSSRDPDFLELDQVPFDVWLEQSGYQAPSLLWYLNYCCRDDYGVPASQVSAWAGLHYFASRRHQPGLQHALMTWPEGNGYLIERMAAMFRDQLQCQALVTELRNTSEGVEAFYYDRVAEVRRRIQAKAVIYAGPHFTVPYVCPEAPRSIPAGFRYAPWLVANVTLRKRPKGQGAPLSWDNVSYTSDSLGYVVSDHQHLRQSPPDRVTVTWYQPLDELPPKEARTAALDRSWEHWRDRVLADLERTHPGIREDVERVDVWIWGHGMISPQPGFVWGEERLKAAEPLGRIHFAHSDLSGISIFEEAFYQGLRAAGEVGTFLGT